MKGNASPTSFMAPEAFGVNTTVYSSGEARKKERTVCLASFACTRDAFELNKSATSAVRNLTAPTCCWPNAYYQGRWILRSLRVCGPGFLDTGNHPCSRHTPPLSSLSAHSRFPAGHPEAKSSDILWSVNLIYSGMKIQQRTWVFFGEQSVRVGGGGRRGGDSIR